jgi:glycine/D-amino acid oxidase-like deaminating enzyme
MVDEGEAVKADAWTVRVGGSYVRTETGNLTLTGSLMDDETQHPMDPELLGSEARFDEVALALPRGAQGLPGLADARFNRGYAGAFDVRPDWIPILDDRHWPDSSSRRECPATAPSWRRW